jgi:hypothetical protein
VKKATLLLWLIIFPFIPLAIGGEVHAAVTFAATELLGRPTDTSITVNVVPSSSGQIYFQYGKTSGVYTGQTSTATLTSGTPYEVVISGLDANTRYYYRMRTSSDGGATWADGTEHSFHTQRGAGSTFKFTVTADSHAQFNTAHQNAMTNILNEQPDFEIDLGDTFSLDGTTSQSAVDSRYLAYRNSAYMGAIGPSIPIFLASGNHEDEEGWNLDDTPFSIAVGSIQARKAYFPTPVNDGFYSGNTDPLAAINAATYGDQYREDYYAWTWGNALFIVIDEFQYTMNLPYASGTAGEGSDDPKTGDQWSWTLGAQQYQWLKTTLQNSDARYKFIFSHQMTGGIPRSIGGVDAGYVRGGAEAAAYFEWGGRNGDGTAGFAAHRNAADFGTEPIHQLMVNYGVSAYFHGHDHQYVYETRDGIVYQEVPSPSLSGSGFSGIYTEGDHGTYNTIKILPNSGHLLVTVTPDHATVDYVSSTSTAGTVNYSYNIAPNSGVTTKTTVSTATTSTTLSTTVTMPTTITSTVVSISTQTQTQSVTVTQSGTVTQSVTVTQSGTVTQTQTRTQTQTSTVTSTQTNMVTQTQTQSVTVTQSGTVTQTVTQSATVTQSGTVTQIQTKTQTQTNTVTSTQTQTQSVTVTQSGTVTQTITQGGTVTLTQSETVTQINTETVTETNTVTEGSGTVTQTQTVGGGQIQVVGQAYVVIGAPLGSLRVTKPAGTSSAAWVDATAASIILGMIQSPSFTYDVNATAINQGQDPNAGGGQPQVPAPSTIVMSGGPLVNGPVAYYENNAHTTRTENAPVYFYQYVDSGNGHTYRECRRSSDDSEILTSKADLSILGNHLDYFVIEAFHDANDNQIVIVYGYTGYGTLAGALYFKTKLFPAMGNTLSDGYQIVQWYDSNANGFVDTADSFTVVGIQNWPVPP